MTNRQACLAQDSAVEFEYLADILSALDVDVLSPIVSVRRLSIALCKAAGRDAGAPPEKAP